MKFLLRLTLPVLILILGIGVYLGIKSLKEEPVQQEVEVRPTLVEVKRVQPHDIQLTVDTQGTVTPRTQTTLVSEVAGRIVSVSPTFQAGGYFEKGEVLLEIDPADYRAALASAQAKLAAQRVMVAQERARSDQAAADWRTLGKGEASSLALRQPQLEEAEAALNSAEAAVEQARRDLERTKIRAPYEGFVREKIADVGQYVSRGSQLGSIFATDYSEVRLPLADEELGYLNLPTVYRSSEPTEGPHVTLTGRYGGKLRSWDAHIVRTEGTVDPTSRLVYAVARIQDPYARHLEEGEERAPLPVGLFVNATIEGITLKNAVQLPRSALREGSKVLVVEQPSDTIDVRDVGVVRTQAGEVIIGSGLSSGELVATSAMEFVLDGMKVEPMPAEGDDLVPAPPSTSTVAGTASGNVEGAE